MAAGNFDACMPFIFREEGGFTKDAHDPGNWTGGKVGKGVLKGTNFGIAANSHPNLDIPNLTKAEAAKLYRVEYWNACSCDLLATGVDLVVMDAAVNPASGAAGASVMRRPRSATR
jgi:lysozyme family protein